MAEVRFGAARGRKGVVVLVTVGTGIGTALLNDGVLVANSELGHLEVNGKIADSWASDAKRTEKDLSWEQWAERLDTYLVKLHALLWPELIVIGGGIVKHAEKFLDQARPGLRSARRRARQPRRHRRRGPRGREPQRSRRCSSA